MSRSLRFDVPPVACDCCGTPLQPVFGSYHRAEREYGWASLPYVLCSGCALEYRGSHNEARVQGWIKARAARAGADWAHCVGQLLAEVNRVVREKLGK
ncbi:hypothetical protein G4G30_04705 [Stenotrophomonas maltophilia]|nr:hypothetical protein G4G30_04705 [Stenotrophomonas maltophilia]